MRNDDPDARGEARGGAAAANGAAAVVRNELGLNPYSGVAYVFRAKRADRIKVLWWDGTGLVLAYKRLEQGRFAWPAVRNGVIRLPRAQFEALFEGLDWRRAWSPRVRRPLTGRSSRRSKRPFGSSFGQSPRLSGSETSRLCVLDSGHGWLIEKGAEFRQLAEVKLAMPCFRRVQIQMPTERSTDMRAISRPQRGRHADVFFRPARKRSGITAQRSDSGHDQGNSRVVGRRCRQPGRAGSRAG